MNIVLIRAPFVGEDLTLMKNWRGFRYFESNLPPLGLAYIGGVLLQNNYRLKIIDCTVGISIAELIRALKEEKPDIVGVTALTSTFISTQKVASLIRKLLPSSIIVIGGAHVSAVPREAMSFDCFDVGVLYEGEITFLELVRHIEENKLNNLHNVQGIVYKRENKLVFTKKRDLINDLDSIPFPAFDLLPAFSKYSVVPLSYRRFPVGIIISTRGCPYRCKFCSQSMNRHYRERSITNVLNEIEYLVGRFGVKEIRFYDDTFTFNKRRVEQFCEEIKKRKIDIFWTCLTRTDTVTKQLLKEMKQAGCWQVLFGVESGDQDILNIYNTDFTLEQSEQAVRWAKEAGLSIRAEFIFGLPSESRISLKKSFDFAKKLGVDYVHFNRFYPIPGTEVYNHLRANGFKMDFSKGLRLIDPLGDTYLPEGLTRKEVEEFLYSAYRKFYLSPGYILRKLISIKNLKEFKLLIRGFLAILSMSIRRLYQGISTNYRHTLT